MRTIIGVDPGSKDSAFAVWDGERICENGTRDNRHFLDSTLGMLSLQFPDAVLAIEQVRSYGMPVGAEIFDTVHWSGRIHQQWENMGGEVLLVPRKEVVLFWNGVTKGNDATVWRAVRDDLGEVGTEKNPGPLIALRGDAHKHERQALALAVCVYRKEVADLAAA